MQTGRQTPRSMKGTWVTIQCLGASLLCIAAGATLWPGHAFAAGPALTIPAGRFSDGQSIGISGVGFPPPAKDPSGVQVIECSDPQGLTANLPSDPSTCDGATVNPLPINIDSAGRFSARYVISALSMHFGTSNIDCDATHYCVLWAGVDYNQAFTSGSHAFSTPFEVDAPASAVSGGAVASPVTRVSTPAPSVPAASPSVATTGVGESAAGPGAALAVTGPPVPILWLIGLGMLLVLSGIVGRRVVAQRSS